MKKLLILAFLFLPLGSHAVSQHTYICSDFKQIGGGATCSAGALTMPAGGSFAQDNNSPAAATFPLNTPTTWYVSFTYSGAGIQGRLICYSNPVGNNCVNAPNSQYFTAGVTDHLLDTSLDATNNQTGIYFRNDSASGTFTISNICISDTQNVCVSTAATPESILSLVHAFWIN